MNRWLLACLLTLSAAIGLWNGAASGRAATARHALHLTLITMITSSRGWGMSGSHVYRTIDGGVDWTDVTPRGVPIGRQDAPFFLDDVHGWLAVDGPGYYNTAQPTVYRTSNAGRSWSAVRSPAPGMAGEGRLFFLNPSVGWLFLIEGLGAGQAPFVLLRTGDAGAHWAQVARTGQGGPQRTQLPGCNCTGAVTFHTPVRGWATGNPGAFPYSSWLWTTGDAGRTWRRQPLTLPRGYQYSVTRAPLFFGPSQGLLPVSLLTAKGGIAFDLFVTHDGGSTWKSSGVLHANVITYSFVDSRTGWAAAGRTLYMTLDGGYHWTVVARGGPIRSQNSGGGQLDFGDHTTGFALTNIESRSGPPNLFKTVDAGRTWRAIRSYSTGTLHG